MANAQDVKNARRFQVLEGGANYALLMIEESRGDDELLSLAHNMLFHINRQIDRHNDERTSPSGEPWSADIVFEVLKGQV